MDLRLAADVLVAVVVVVAADVLVAVVVVAAAVITAVAVVISAVAVVTAAVIAAVAAAVTQLRGPEEQVARLSTLLLYLAAAVAEFQVAPRVRACVVHSSSSKNGTNDREDQVYPS